MKVISMVEAYGAVRLIQERILRGSSIWFALWQMKTDAAQLFFRRECCFEEARKEKCGSSWRTLICWNALLHWQAEDVKNQGYTLAVNNYIEKKPQEITPPAEVRRAYFQALKDVYDAEEEMKRLLVEGGYVNE